MLNRTSEELTRDVRLYTALMLFRLGKLSPGAATEMADVPRVMFRDLCGEYDIPLAISMCSRRSDAALSSRWVSRLDKNEPHHRHVLQVPSHAAKALADRIDHPQPF